MPLILFLLAAAFVAHFFWLLVAVAVTPTAGRLIGAALTRHDDRDAWRRRLDAELRARADRQHAAVLAGDERRVYGDYPPAVEGDARRSIAAL
jgi:hypothetical protein